MIDISTASNAELDALGEYQDEKRGDRVLRRAQAFASRFIAFPSEHCGVAHVLWCAHTHRMDLWGSTPRLAVLSPEPASGKSRVLEISELLVPRPINTVNSSPAYLFRKVADEDGPPTVLFDEIDTVFGPKAKENEETRGWLNAGHRRGATAGRCVMRGKVVETEELPAYCAVAVAGLGWLPDTILTRSVIIRMRRRHAGEVVEPFRHRVHEREGHAIRAELETWMASLPSEIDWPELPPSIQDRDADVWEPLIAIADHAGGDWPARARAAAVALVADAKETEPSLGVRLLADIKAVVGDREVIASKVLIQGLQELAEAPWQELKGKPLDERRLATLLKQYGLKSKSVRVGDLTPKGYAKADFHDAWARYLPSPAKSATRATDATVVPFSQDVARVAGVALPAGDEPLCEQCGAAGGDLVRRPDGSRVRLHCECKPFWRGG
jgi:hypothetical protein